MMTTGSSMIRAETTLPESLHASRTYVVARCIHAVGFGLEVASTRRQAFAYAVLMSGRHLALQHFVCEFLSC